MVGIAGAREEPLYAWIRSWMHITATHCPMHIGSKKRHPGNFQSTKKWD